MIKEIIKFNCHILKTNTHPDNITPDILFAQYNNKTLVFENIETIVSKVDWASGSKSTILTTVKRKDNDDLRNK